MTDKIKKTLNLLDKFDKEQSELEKKDKIKSNIENRTIDFLQHHFNDRYAIKIMLIGLPITVILCYWTVYGNTFNDGFLRFGVAFLLITLFVKLPKHLLFNKLKKEFALSEVSD